MEKRPSRSRPASSAVALKSGLCVCLAFRRTANAAHLVISKQNEKAIEEEARWRLGDWWNRQWCSDALDLSSDRFDGIDFEFPEMCGQFRRSHPDGPVVNDRLAALFRERGEAAERQFNEKLASFGARELLKSKDYGDVAERLVLCPIQQCLPVLAPTLPVLAATRRSPYATTGGIVLWSALHLDPPKLRQALELPMRDDTPWEQKKDSAVWRGLGTGPLTPSPVGGQASRAALVAAAKESAAHSDDNSGESDPGGGGGDSSGGSGPVLIDAAFLERPVRHPLNDQALERLRMSQNEAWEWIDSLSVENSCAGAGAASYNVSALLQHKVVVAIDGSTSPAMLAWALASESAVAMQEPSAWESLLHYGLRPWVHYLPFRPDLSDLAVAVKFCLENADACRQIGHDSAAHIRRLLDPGYEEAVRERMLRRLRDNMRTCGGPAGQAPRWEKP